MNIRIIIILSAILFSCNPSSDGIGKYNASLEKKAKYKVLSGGNVFYANTLVYNKDDTFTIRVLPPFKITPFDNPKYKTFPVKTKTVKLR